jgi:hypothetical protein
MINNRLPSCTLQNIGTSFSHEAGGKKFPLPTAPPLAAQHVKRLIENAEHKKSNTDRRYKLTNCTVTVSPQLHLLCVITDTRCCITMHHAEGSGDLVEQATRSPPFGFLLKARHIFIPSKILHTQYTRIYC